MDKKKILGFDSTRPYFRAIMILFALVQFLCALLALYLAYYTFVSLFWVNNDTQLQASSGIKISFALPIGLAATSGASLLLTVFGYCFVRNPNRSAFIRYLSLLICACLVAIPIYFGDLALKSSNSIE